MRKSCTNVTKNCPDSRKRASWQACAALSLGCLLFAFLLTQIQLQNQREALASRLSPSILRFHILADSDQKEDQKVKLEVRSLILDYLKSHLPAGAGKRETIACLAENKQEIEALAEKHLKKQGFDYQATLQPITSCYFPTRTYGSYVFPCGYYDAARITLGKGKGHNWWCVLYPQFCFVDETLTAVPAESTQILQTELKQDDYLAIQDNRPDIKIRFLFFPELGQSTDMDLPSKNLAGSNQPERYESACSPVSH
ncbi:MAG: stage II sporulation protein R [Lachnospiraceae bacterium]|jgi:stage II sporulation protein R|nr:stage II sporulation protein R [Lachnospiraceae bacterium]